MKTAASIPDDAFQGAARLAEEVTDAMDRICAVLGQPTDEFVRDAGRRTLERSEW